MPVTNKKKFDPSSYLKAAGVARRIIHVKAKDSFFSQGIRAKTVFYLESGRARLIVVSKKGKEATVCQLSAGDFIGEDCLAHPLGFRSATAVALTPCVALVFRREEMLRLLNQAHEFSVLFLKFILLRAVRTQDDLLDQLFNNSEKRLARTLLLMAEFGRTGEPEPVIPHITQGALAEMIGTTRSRVSFFMNRFRKLGFIEYNGHITVNKSLLNVVLYDKLPKQSAKSPVALDLKPTAALIRERAAII
ncbi:MAG: Crp/Fnr family transcriptional regulator [Acidobacteriaceae bacterium]